MRIIQTYWSRPSENLSPHVHARNNGGWLAPRYNLMSTALSCLSLKRFYRDVELYTDQTGKQLLIEKMKLPYSKVNICLEPLHNIPTVLWATAKLYVYGLQENPFLHVDNDIYIWKKFDKRIGNGELIAQHEEINFPFYKSGIDFFLNHIPHIPDILKIAMKKKDIISINAGIIGGMDIDFMRRYSKTALELILSNKSSFDLPGLGHMNYIVEQFLFSCLARKENKTIKYLQATANHDYSDLTQFNYTPRYKSFIHMVGTAKNNITSCQMVEKHLQYYFPEYYNFLSNIVECKKEYSIDSGKFSYSRNTREISYFLRPNVNKPGSKSNLNITKHGNNFKLKEENIDLFLMKDINHFKVQHTRLTKRSNAFYDKVFRDNSFQTAKSILATHSKKDILKKRLKMTTPLSTSIHSFPVHEITKNENWHSAPWINAFSYEKKQFVLVHIKYALDFIDSKELRDVDKLLYYIDKNNLNGNDLVDILRSQDETNNKLKYREIIYGFISEQLLYTNFVKVLK